MLKKLIGINRIIAFALIGALFVSNTAFSWGYRGHILIAQIAYDNLNTKAKKKADNMASLIFKRLPLKFQHRLNTNYPNVSTFAKIAVLPDYWRNWKLGTVFHKNHASIPANLWSYRNQRTSAWHFIDQAYPNKDCQTVNKQNVVWAINNLENAMHGHNSVKTNAVLMVFMEHLVGDSSQPLHTMTEVNKQCKTDRGGNLFCLRKNQSGYCRDNLHALWDKGVGYLKRRSNLANKAIHLQNEFPRSKELPNTKNIQPKKWVESEYKLATLIYNTPEYEKPSSVYYRAGQAVAKKQIISAGYRLSYILNTLL